MAEKIYQDNVVLHKNAMDELLTQIRNYPIIDIQEVSETDKDLINTSKNVWETYTGGHPAWRVMFGDPDNLSGNYSRLSSEVRASIRQLEGLIRVAEQKSALYSKFQGSIDDYNNAIKNIKDEFTAVCNAVEATYRNQYAQLLNYIQQSHYNSKDNPTNDFTADFNNIAQSVRMQFCINQTKVTNYLNFRNAGDMSHNLNDFHYFSVAESSSLNYSNTDKQYNNSSPQQWHNITIINNESSLQTSQLWRRLEAVIDPNANGMTTDNPNYEIWSTVWVPNAQKAEAIIQSYNDYFEDAENTLYNLTVLTKLSNYFLGITETKRQRAAAINQINTNNGLPQESQSVIESTYPPSKITATISGYRAQIEAYKQEALSSTSGDKKITGYKYVPVGDEIHFYKNLFVANSSTIHGYRKEMATGGVSDGTTTMGDQRYGTFRCTINDLLWEMPIKGFEDSTIKDMIIKNKTTNGGNITLYSQSGDIILQSGNAAKTIQLKNPVTIGTNANATTTYLTVNGAAAITGAASIGKNFSVGGNSTFSGNVTIGTTSSNKNLTVNGTSNLNGNTIISGNTTLNGTLTVGSSSTNKDTTMNGNLTVTGTITGAKYANIKPSTSSVDIGASNDRWRAIYGTTGNFTNLIVNGKTINNDKIDTAVNGSSDTTKFWRGDASWSNNLTGTLAVGGTVSSTHINIGSNSITCRSANNDTSYATLSINGATFQQGTNATTNTVYSYITATKLYNAVFNDYAEFRKTIDLEPGRVVVDKDDGSLECSSKRLQPGAQVISDTYGHSMGETPIHKTPLAVAGRVLVYPYQPRHKYHAGMAVCSAPDGTVDIMTREEIKEYPDCIIGIVSEIPQYSNWGTDNVKVNGRIWIKVR